MLGFAIVFLLLAFCCLLLEVWMLSMEPLSNEMKYYLRITRINGWCSVVLAVFALLVV